MPPKTELSLPHCSLLCVANVVVLDYIFFFHFLVVSFITNAYKHKNILWSFPHCIHGNLLFSHIVLNTHLLRESVDVIFSIGVISNVVSFKHPFLVMSCFEPTHHGVSVSFFRDILMSPLFIFCLVNIEWLFSRPWRIIVIRQFIPIVIVSSEFLNAQIFCIAIGDYLGLIWLLIEKVVRCSSKLMFF
jgi:hypothetical protein